MKNKLTTLLFLLPLTLSALNIQEILSACPLDDPNITEIIEDFKFTIDDECVDLDFTCSDFFSDEYDQYKTWLQALRIAYYLEVDAPWTDKPYYKWISDNVQGINFKKDYSGGFCCQGVGDRAFMITGISRPPDDFLENFVYPQPYIFYYQDVLGKLIFLTHEARHQDGAYQHSSCCERGADCDTNYNVDDLGSYGTMIWMHQNILNGNIDIGFWDADLNNIHPANFANFHKNNHNFFSDVICNGAPLPIDYEREEAINFWGGQTTPINELEKSKELIYPNPLRLGERLNIENYKIFSISGKELNEFETGLNLIQYKGKFQKIIVN